MRRVPLALVLLAAACTREAPPEAGADGAAASTGGAAAHGVRFVDQSGAWGLDFVHDAGFSADKQLPETMGAGAALFDADEDGDLDLYLVQSGPLPLTPERDSAPPNRLYLNAGDGSLRDATERCGDGAHRGYGMGVCVGDADGDGHTDLYLTNLGPDVLLAGDGAASFSDVTARAGLGDPRWTAGALFLDPDEDGDLDLYVTAYLALDLHEPAWCGERREGWRSYCHPDHYQGLQDRYWRNDGRGRFTDATLESGLADSGGKGLGAIAADFDGDGHTDLYVANDSVENRMWSGDGRGHFDDATLLSGTGVNGLGLTEAGMGLAVGDVDGDLLPDLYVTNFDDESNTLYRNDGGGLFTDETAPRGLEGPTRLFVGFGCVLADLDLDGDLDVAVANGHIIDNIHLTHDGKRWRQPAVLLLNDGAGHFRDASAEAGALCATPRVGRGLYAGDLDGDGDPDLVQTECGGRARVFRNEAAPRPRVAVHGLPTGASVLFTLADGRRFRREGGARPSYFGCGETTAWLAGTEAGVVSLEVRRPGHEALEHRPERPLVRAELVLDTEGARLAPRPGSPEPRFQR